MVRKSWQELDLVVLYTSWKFSSTFITTNLKICQNVSLVPILILASTNISCYIHVSGFLTKHCLCVYIIIIMSPLRIWINPRTPKLMLLVWHKLKRPPQNLVIISRLLSPFPRVVLKSWDDKSARLASETNNIMDCMYLCFYDDPLL